MHRINTATSAESVELGKAEFASATIGAALNVLRVARGESQIDVAEQLKVSQPTVSHIESGKHFDFAFFLKYCKLLEKEPEEVFAIARQILDVATKNPSTVLTSIKERIRTELVFAAKEEVSPASQQVSLSDTGKLLRRCRESRSQSIDDIVYRSRFSRVSIASVSITSTTSDPDLRRILLKIETVNPKKDKQISLVDAYKLADIYCLPALIVDALATKPATGDIVVESLREFIALGSRRDGNDYGKETKYHIPQWRVGNSYSVAFLTLEARVGVSDLHSHPGEELVFVLQGTVNVHINSMGLRETIQQGEYMHFNSDQEHMITNSGMQSAWVLVVRTLLTTAQRGGGRTLVDGVFDVEPVVGRTAATLHGNASTSIKDTVGYTHLLRRVAQMTNRGPDEIVKAAKESGLEIASEEIGAIFGGKYDSRIASNDIGIVSRVFGVAEIILSNYKFPAVQGCVVVRQEDYGVIDPGNVSDGPRLGQYRLPCRTLSGSSISIAFLKMQCDEASPWNMHPGVEILVPMSGCVSVDLLDRDDEQKPINCKTVDFSKVEYCQFRSSSKHRVVNRGSCASDVLVIRIYDGEKCGERSSVDRTPSPVKGSEAAYSDLMV